MCVIIIKENKNIINHATLVASALKNPDGLGIIWLDTFELEKIPSDKYEKLLTTRPFIAHFRYATVGKINLNNCHPFSIDKDNLLFQNGTVPGLGNLLTTDTQELAELLADLPETRWRQVLEMTNCRYVVANTKTNTFEIYNPKLWHSDSDGIMYSKANVLGFSFMAVYGTLKLKHSNYYSYLTQSEYVGSAETVDKYPLIVDGLPYLLSKKGVGHNVDVDVFLVDKDTMIDVDMLEGHPNWYKRQKTPVRLFTGEIVEAWIYFNDTIKDSGVHHQSYADGYVVEDRWNDDSNWEYYNPKFEDVPLEERMEGEVMEAGVDCNNCSDQLWYDEYEARLYCMTCSTYKDEQIDEMTDVYYK